MAIFHLSIKNISAARQGAVAAAAYRTGLALRDTVRGKSHDFTHRQDVIFSKIYVPDDAPEWAKAFDTQLGNPDYRDATEKLWNLASERETKSTRPETAREAIEIELALHNELSVEENIALAEQFIKEHLMPLGIIAQASWHYDEKNFHVHIEGTTRHLEEDGFGLKIRELSANKAKSKALFNDFRQGWATISNKGLAKAGHQVAVTHLSHEDRGLSILPTKHEGPAPKYHQQAREVAQEENRIIREENRKIIQAAPELLVQKIAQEKPVFSRADIKAEIARYQDPKNYNAEIERLVLEKYNQEEKRTKTKQALLDKINQSLEAHFSVFSEKDMAKAVTTHIKSTEEFLNVMDDLKTSGSFIHLGYGSDGVEKFTTRYMFELELETQKVCEALNQKHTHVVKEKVADAIIEKYGLSNGQDDALKYVLSGPDVVAITGYAGTGKSYMMRAAREAYEAQGYNVLGCAVQGLTASELERDSNIPSRTIASLLLAVEKGKLALTKKDVMVVDEAGMVDSVSMAKLHNLVSKAGAKIINLGDGEQINPVGPGAFFRAIVEQIGCTTLYAVRRQEQKWQRDATVLFAQKRTEQALQAYRDNGRLRLTNTQDEAKAQLIGNWAEKLEDISREQRENKIDFKGNPLSQCLILAHANVDVLDLNLKARERLINDERLVGNDVQVKTQRGKRAIRQGERILFLKNERSWFKKDGLTVKNGERGTVLEISASKMQVQIDAEDGKGRIITVPFKQYNDFDYGYASTVHKSQGMTVMYGFVYGAGNWVRNLAYVALSRHKRDAWAYGSQQSHRDMEGLIKNFCRDGTKDSVLDWPREFLLRRGVPEEMFERPLMDHLKLKLKNVAKAIGEKVEAHLYPEVIEVRQQQEKEKQNQVIEFEKQQAAWGFVGTDYTGACQAARQASKDEHNNKDYRKRHQYSIQVQETRHMRDAMAVKILEDIELYETVLERRGIKKEDLERQALAYQRRERVKQYITAVNQQHFETRNELAATLMKDIKSHKHYLASYDAPYENQIQLQAWLYQIKPHVDETIYEKASQYVQQVATTAHLQKQAKAQPFVRRSDVVELQQGMLRNQQIAYELIASQQIPMVQQDFIGPPSLAETILLESARRLSGDNRRHQARQRYSEYRQNIEQGNSLRAKELAHAILQDPKAHHVAIVDWVAKTTDGNHKLELLARSQAWQQIRKDAKAFEEHTVRSVLSIQEKMAWDRVKNYVNIKRELGKTWYETKSQFKDTKELPTAVSDIINELSIEKMKLSDMAVGSKIYTAAIDFFKLDVNELKEVQNKAEIAEKLKAFKENNNTAIAKEAMLNLKSYIPVALTLGINPDSLFKAANQHDKQVATANFNDLEKEGFARLEEYLDYQKEAAIAWEKFHKQKAMGIIDKGLLEDAQHASHYRDSVAHAIASHPVTHQPMMALLRPNETDKHWEKLVEYANRFDEVPNLAEALDISVNDAKKIPISTLTDEELEKIAYAKEVFANSKDIKGTIAEKYLASRGIKDFNSENVRFGHVKQFWDKDLDKESPELPALICFGKNAKGEMQALQAIYLTESGEKREDLKVKKKTFGPAKKSPCLIQKGKDESHIYLAEGPETAMSIAKANPDATIYCTFGKANMMNFEMPMTTSKITICADNDGVHWKEDKTIKKAVEHLNVSGLVDVWVAQPKGNGNKVDFNDVLQQSGIEGVKNALSKADTASKSLSLALFKENQAASLYQHKALKPIPGTLLDKHLRKDNLRADVDCDIYYHPKIWDKASNTSKPAMVSFARDENNQVQSFRISYIEPHGIEDSKNTAVYGEEKPNQFCMVNEGSQTGVMMVATDPKGALALANAFPEHKVCMTPSLTSFEKSSIDGEVKHLILFAEPGAKGPDVVEKTKHHKTDREYTVLTTRKSWDKLYQSQGLSGFRGAVNQSIPERKRLYDPKAVAETFTKTDSIVVKVDEENKNHENHKTISSAIIRAHYLTGDKTVIAHLDDRMKGRLKAYHDTFNRQQHDENKDNIVVPRKDIDLIQDISKKLEHIKESPEVEKEQRNTLMTLVHHVEMRGLVPAVEALGYEKEIGNLSQRYSKQRSEEYYEKIYAKNRALHKQIGLYDDRDDRGIGR
mgnify:CR=1 FL=1